jgi:ssDNA-binding Zn-finger/Zn-ribbon topoisomerase 1
MSIYIFSYTPRVGWTRLIKYYYGVRTANQETPEQDLAMDKRGTTHTDETRKKMSEAKKGKTQPKVTCPHCGKSGGNVVMKRWHFDNCKTLDNH